MVPKYDGMCSKIFKLDRLIRYAAVLDKDGRLLAGGIRKGFQSLEPKAEELRLGVHIASQARMDEAWNQYFGKSLYTFTKRENVCLLIIPRSDRLVVVSAEPEFSLGQIANVREVVLNNFP